MLLGILEIPLLIALLIVDEPLADEAMVFAVTTLLGVVAAAFVSCRIANPLRELVDVADRIAAGEMGAHVPVRGTEEVAALATSINRLSESLRSQVTDLDAARDEVRSSVRRLGEALRAVAPGDVGGSADPRNLTRLLAIVLETALVAVRGASGAVWLLTSRRDALHLKVGRQLPEDIAQSRVPIGHGLAGWVAEHRAGALVPGDAPIPADPEPVTCTALAVPIETQSAALGVLAIYGKQDDALFDARDLEAIFSLARQAGIGIDNMLLAQEAKRLSITDGLTGVWNRRWFDISISREFERAVRFHRELALLMIDLDDFKIANDRYGHQRGDAILIELARRIHGVTRVNVDIAARYGGEEFVLILPETGRAGARSVGEKIRQEVAETLFGADGEEAVRITVSIGYATYPADGLTPQILLRAADEALYAAKAAGKNRVTGAHELDR